MILIEIWTDGMGSFRARCKKCEWVSEWFERASKGKTCEEKAVLAANIHGLIHESE